VISQIWGKGGRDEESVKSFSILLWIVSSVLFRKVFSPEIGQIIHIMYVILSQFYGDMNCSVMRKSFLLDFHLRNESCTYKGDWTKSVLFMKADLSWALSQLPQGLHWFSEVNLSFLCGKIRNCSNSLTGFVSSSCLDFYLTHGYTVSYWICVGRLFLEF
jgi:hypothetical protein